MSSKLRSKILKEILKGLMGNETNSLYEFGRFRFDGKQRKLWCEDQLILISPKAAELLSLLLEKNGEFASKDEIFETVWAGTFVEEGVLTQNIYTLRKALGNDENALPIVENKTRLGYRIAVPIIKLENAQEVIDDNTETDETVAAAEGDESPVRNRSGFSFLLKPQLLFALVALIGFTLAAYFYFRPQSRKPIESIKFTQLSNTSDLATATLSPDGNFLAFVRRNKVYLKDIASNKEIPLEIPNVPSFRSLEFSADGNFLYFCNNSAYNAGSKILKVSRFGGDTELIVERNQGLFSLSPDNRYLAYYAGYSLEGLKLMVKDLVTKSEREVLRLSGAESTVLNNSSLSWSSDGKRILSSTQSVITTSSQLILVDIETGKSEEIKIPKLRRFQEAHWLPDGVSFIVSATENGRTYNLYKVHYPSGEFQLLTTGLSSFEKPVVSRDGKKILTLQSTNNSNIFLANSADLNKQAQLTTGNTNKYGQTSLTWTDENEILFSSQMENDLVENFWLLDSTSLARRQITAEKVALLSNADSDGKSIAYTVMRGQFASLEKINADGGNLVQLKSSKTGGNRSPQFSSDGNWLYYIFRETKGAKIMRLSLQSNEEEVFFDDEKVQCGLFLQISPDGKYLACPNWRQRTVSDADRYNAEIAIISVETKSMVKLLAVERLSPNFRFSPDSNAIEFIAASDAGSQIIRQSISDGKSAPILNLPTERIFNFDWSFEGKKLAISRGQQLRDAVLLTDFNE